MGGRSGLGVVGVLAAGRICPHAGTRLHHVLKASMDHQRRSFLRGRPLAPAKQAAPRPPWSVAEADFVALCTRCDACIPACPEGILFKGDGAFPEVRFTQTGCTACGRCVEACVPKALSRSANQEPWVLRAEIGIDCLALKKVECRVCGESCDAGAIRFMPVLGGVSSPALDRGRCTGCGMCVAPCPTKAIAMV